MKHIQFGNAAHYPVALLLKATAFNKSDIESHYVTPLANLGVQSDTLIAFTLKYDANAKVSVKFMKDYLSKLLPAMDSIGVKHLYVTDGAYFKVLAGTVKAEPHTGYVLPCKYPGFTHMNVILGINHQALIFNPALQPKLSNSLGTLASKIQGSYAAPGSGIIHSAQYPESLQDIAAALDSLHQYKELTCDIEAFSLRFNEAGIGTIAFAWDQHNGVAFACDYKRIWDSHGNYDKDCQIDIAAFAGFNKPNKEVRALLLNFFTTYKGEVTWHNSTYDLKVIIYNLWMSTLLDTEGLLTGLEIMTQSFQDTKIIAYLATNSTAGNVLKLKLLAQEFAGNWAKDDIKDIRRIPLDELLQYNLVDTLSTWFVKTKYTHIMKADKQEDLYECLMKPSLKTIIQMELTGMPISLKKVAQVKEKLQSIQAEHLDLLENSPVIKVLNLIIQSNEMEKANAKLKTKQHPLEKYSGTKFNPSSGPQLQRLLYEQMGLPILDYTDTKQPATGADTIKKLINHTQEPAYRELLSALIGYTGVSKILSTFIPAFERAIVKEDGSAWLHGNFNLGGTVSGRLSSSDPNLQNLPAGSEYGKLIKECFVSEKGHLFVGADFTALEDRINALLTKDPNKLKVFTDGYDSHCLRAFYFFPDRLPGITETVSSINSIKTIFPQVRQDAKSPAFAIQYAGTWRTLVKNLGFAEGLAKQIEHNFHKMYSVSGDWVKEEINKAAQDGYATTAFGLRIRTPLLKQTFLGMQSTPREAEAEARTLGNAISGQSFGLLNNRAANAFMEKVRKSKYALQIKPVALIHDAIYLFIKDDADVVAWVNKELIEAMQWQELPELQHPTVKLGAALDIYWPSWTNAITLPNNTDVATIRSVCDAAKLSYMETHNATNKVSQ